MNLYTLVLKIKKRGKLSYLCDAIININPGLYRIRVHNIIKVCIGTGDVFGPEVVIVSHISV
jgi:hypothetical protein